MLQTGLHSIGANLPLFVCSRFAAIILTNTVPRVAKIPWPAGTRSLALVSDVSLGVLLATSLLMSLQLWTIVELAGPILTILAAQNRPRRRLKNPRMSRCCQFSEDRKEPSAGRSPSATDKLGDTARAENWRNPRGREPFGASPGVAPQLQPLQGMRLRRSTDTCPKELTRDVRGFFNSLLALVFACS
jgi:Sodium/glutamate symporter